MGVKQVSKSRMMGWVAHVACMGEIRNAYIIFCQKTVREYITWET
jgi:hypothetical protein